MRIALILSPFRMSASLNHLRRVPARRTCPWFAWRVMLPVLLLVFAAARAHGAENPTDLVATLEDGELALSWSAPTTNASAVTGYQVLRRVGIDAEGAFNEQGTTGARETTYVDAGFEAGETYAYRVKARRGDKLSDSSNTASIDVPPAPLAPANLSSSSGHQYASLSWTNPNDASITGYQYRYRTGDAWEPDWTDLEPSDAATTGHRLTGLTNGTSYTIQVRAKNAGGSGAAAGVGAKPVGFPPTNLSVGVVDGSVTVSWDAPAADAEFVTGYEVLRRRPRIDGRGVFHAIATTGAGDRTYVDGSVEGGEKYAYRVKAWRGTDLSLWSGWANIVAPLVPSAPANLSAAAGDGMVTLSWDDANDATITDYQYRYRTGMTWDPDWTDIDPSDETTTSHTLQGLTNGTEHTFEVRAINANGNGTTASVTATPVSPPSAPANLTATTGVSEVTLEWDDPGDAAITVYQLKYGHGTTVVQAWSDISGSGASTTHHTVAGLTNGTAYTFRLRAKATDALGDSSEVAATPVPASPANLKASAGDGTVRLNWDDPGDAAITAYQLVRYSGTRPSQPTWNDISGSGATTTTHTVASLTNGTEYTFELRAKAGSVYGDSSTVSATPLSPPPPPQPTPCPSISVGGLSNVTATLGTTIKTIRARATGGRSPYSYSATRLPQGISIDKTTGDISGTVGAADYRTLNVTVTARDQDECTGSGSFTFNVPCNVSIGGLPNGQKRVQVAELFTIQATASGGREPYEFLLTGVPPFHVTMNKEALIVGKIPIEGNGRTFNAKVSVKDRDLCTAAHSFDLVVYCPAITVSVSGLSNFGYTVGDSVSLRASASGGRLPHTYSLRQAPSWLTISESGSIEGVAELSNRRSPIVVATDSVKCTGERIFLLSVSRRGDFNRDGSTDASDGALFTKRSGLNSSDTGFDPRMDLNRDGTINFADGVILSGYIEQDTLDGASESDDDSE